MVGESSNVWANYQHNDPNYYLKRQFIYSLIGMASFIIGYFIKESLLKKYSLWILLFTFILLILVIIPGVGITKNGSSSWLGFSIFTFQPSEFFKLAIILFVAAYLDKNYYQSKSFKYVIPLLLVIVIGLVLIMLQPDFGTCMVIVISIFFQLFLSRLPNKWFVIGMLIGIILISFLILKESYRMERITAYLDPFDDPLGAGFQIIQSLYAIGPGGLVGQGINGSIQKYYYLPEPMSDFIYAIIIEEFGLIGGLIVVLLYSLIFFAGFKLIKAEKSLFKAYLSLGLLTLFLIQVIINLGVVIGLFPVTGITLPLISYGGSSLIIVMFSLGIIINKGDIKK